MLLTWEMATKSSVSIETTPSCLIARCNDPIEMQDMCFGRTFIFVRNRSTRFIAVNRTSFDKSYQTLRHRRTWAAPSLSAIVISPSLIMKNKWKSQLKNFKNKNKVNRLNKICVGECERKSTAQWHWKTYDDISISCDEIKKN